MTACSGSPSGTAGAIRQVLQEAQAHESLGDTEGGGCEQDQESVPEEGRSERRPRLREERELWLELGRSEGVKVNPLRTKAEIHSLTFRPSLLREGHHSYQMNF